MKTSKRGARLLAAVRADMLIQGRNQLYAISVFVSVLMAAALAMFASEANLSRVVPMAILFIAGGSTLLYITGMLSLERDDGVLAALTVSPLRPWEYILSKTLTLSLLTCIEGAIIVAGAWGWLWRADASIAAPGWEILPGVLCLGAVHVLAGFVLVVRYRRFMDALIPMSLVAVAFQIPAFYFLGALKSPLWLCVPTGAPAMWIKAGFVNLTLWEWCYATGGTLLTMGIFWFWALRAYERHVVQGFAR